jgi:hypothetical protein
VRSVFFFRPDFLSVAGWNRHTLPPSFGLWVGWCGLVMCVAVKGWVSHVLNALSILSFLQWRFSVLLGAMDSLNDVKLHS